MHSTQVWPDHLCWFQDLFLLRSVIRILLCMACLAQMHINSRITACSLHICNTEILNLLLSCCCRSGFLSVGGAYHSHLKLLYFWNQGGTFFASQFWLGRQHVYPSLSWQPADDTEQVNVSLGVKADSELDLFLRMRGETFLVCVEYLGRRGLK